MPDKVHTKYFLSEDQMPKAWYNIAPDLPTPPAPVLHPGTKQPVGPDDLEGLEEAAWGLALPGLAKTAAAQGLDESIPGDWLRVRLPYETHDMPFGASRHRTTPHQCADAHLEC